MHIELTDGWDGKAIKESDVPNKKDAFAWLKCAAPDPQNIVGIYVTHTDTERTIIDYGSHRYFGRLTELNERPGTMKEKPFLPNGRASRSRKNQIE